MDPAVARGRPRRGGRSRADGASAATLCLALALAIAASAAPPIAQAPEATPASDLQGLLRRIRANVQHDREIESRYTYLETRRDIRVRGLGKVVVGDERTFEVYPSSAPGGTYKRLIAVNGRPLLPDELAQRDARHRDDLLGQMRAREAETRSQRLARERDQAERDRRRAREVDEAFDAFEYRVVGRESRDPHPRPLLVVSMTPRPNAPASGDLPRYARRFKGRAWVDEDDAQVARIELEAIDDILIGLGFVGRVHKGSRATYERREVNDEVWLPVRASLDLAGRTLLFRKFDVQVETRWSDYRRFNVETEITSVTPPK